MGVTISMRHPAARRVVLFALACAAILSSSARAGAQPAAPPPPALVPSVAPVSLREPSLPAMPAVPAHRNDAMRIAGIALTSIACTAMAAGLTVMFVDIFRPEDSDASTSGIYAIFVGATLMGGSTVLAGIGIPLWVIGGKSPELAPRVSLTSSGARLQF